MNVFNYFFSFFFFQLWCLVDIYSSDEEICDAVNNVIGECRNLNMCACVRLHVKLCEFAIIYLSFSFPSIYSETRGPSCSSSLVADCYDSSDDDGEMPNAKRFKADDNNGVGECCQA